MDRKTIGVIASALLLGAGTISTAHAESVAAMPAWLSGGWSTHSEAGDWTEEWWTSAKAGLMLGSGRSGKGEKLLSWEQTRIEVADGTVRFCALPKGQSEACFPATRVAPDEVVFENPKHDFPTRVAYRRAGDRLFAEISGPGGSNVQRWAYSRIP